MNEKNESKAIGKSQVHYAVPSPVAPVICIPIIESITIQSVKEGELPIYDDLKYIEIIENIK